MDLPPRSPIGKDPLAQKPGGLRRFPHRDLFCAVGRLEIDQQFASRSKVRDEARLACLGQAEHNAHALENRSLGQNLFGLQPRCRGLGRRRRQSDPRHQDHNRRQEFANHDFTFLDCRTRQANSAGGFPVTIHTAVLGPCQGIAGFVVRMAAYYNTA